MVADEPGRKPGHVCLECRWIEVRSDPSGAAYFWCRVKRRSVERQALFNPACANFRKD